MLPSLGHDNQVWLADQFKGKDKVDYCVLRYGVVWGVSKVVAPSEGRSFLS